MTDVASADAQDLKQSCPVKSAQQSIASEKLNLKKTVPLLKPTVMMNQPDSAIHYEENHDWL
jgi:hypothetical protein